MAPRQRRGDGPAAPRLIGSAWAAPPTPRRLLRLRHAADAAVRRLRHRLGHRGPRRLRRRRRRRGAQTTAPDRARAPAATGDRPARPRRRGQSRGVRLVPVGASTSRSTSPRRPATAAGLRRRAGRAHPRRPRRPQARAPFLDIRDAGDRRRRAGPARPRLRARLRAQRAASTSTSPAPTAKRARRRVPARAPRTAPTPASARLVLVQDDPEPNHNGGMLAFGPDGLLYIGTGDGGGGDDQHGARGNAQNLGSPLGKILRIDPRAAGGRPYTIPAANPFAGRAGARAEIYAYGLRNPWRFSFDRATGDLAHRRRRPGRGRGDRLRRAGARRAGANFGWRPFEGTRRNFDEPAPGARPPVIDARPTSDGWCSITGGYVVRDRACRRSTAATSTATTARASCARARCAPARARGDRADRRRPDVAGARLVRRGRAGRVYVVSQAGAGLPVRRALSGARGRAPATAWRRLGGAAARRRGAARRTRPRGRGRSSTTSGSTAASAARPSVQPAA